MVLLGTNTRGRVAPPLLLTALATTVAVCGGSDGDTGATVSDRTAAAADQTWKKVDPGGANRQRGRWWALPPAATTRARTPKPPAPQAGFCQERRVERESREAEQRRRFMEHDWRRLCRAPASDRVVEPNHTSLENR
jgi:hypothetical protein